MLPADLYPFAWLVTLVNAQLIADVLAAACQAAAATGGGCTWLHVLAGVDGHAAVNAVLGKHGLHHLRLQLNSQSCLSAATNQLYFTCDIIAAAAVSGLRTMLPAAATQLVNTDYLWHDHHITALAMAAVRSTPGLMAVLLYHRAAANVEFLGHKPLACVIEMTECGAALSSARLLLCRGLLAGGADPNDTSIGKSVFLRALHCTQKGSNQRAQLLKSLLDYGLVNVDCKRRTATALFSEALRASNRLTEAMLYPDLDNLPQPEPNDTVLDVALAVYSAEWAGARNSDALLASAAGQQP
jgi:hypothetical protein